MDLRHRPTLGVNYTANIQKLGESTPLVAGAAPIGALAGFDSPTDVAKSAHGNRIWLIIITIIFFLAMVVAGVGAGYAIYNRNEHIERDSQTNDYQSAVVEVYSVPDGEGEYSVCSGFMVSSTGEALTASHCVSDPDPCTFDLADGRYFVNKTFYVDVMGINGTTEKRTFNAEVIGWSGITDIAVLQIIPTAPFSPSGDPQTIAIVAQDYLSFGDSTYLERGETVTAMAYDLAFLKKLAHEGAVQAIHKDRAGGFSVGVEQVFFDGNMRSGSSGAGVFNKDGKVVIAPVSYLWQDGLSVSGTSSRVTVPLLARILNVATPPNSNYDNRYLVPTLGIVSYQAIGFVEALTFTSGYLRNLGYTQNKGVTIDFLADQAWFDYVYTTLATCGSGDPYEVEPPSLLNAPLTVTRYGEPPALFPSDPTGGNPDVRVLLVAIEKDLNANNWVELGEDAGLETTSGVILSSGKWVGDEVRVLIKAYNSLNDTGNPLENWEGIYTVTLRAIDTFFDTPYNMNLASYANRIHVPLEQATRSDSSSDKAPLTLYLDPAVQLPVRPKHVVHLSEEAVSSAREGKTRYIRNVNGHASVRFAPISFAHRLSPLPSGADIASMPTLQQMFVAHKQKLPIEHVMSQARWRKAPGPQRSLNHSYDRSKMNNKAHPSPRRAPHNRRPLKRELNPNNRRAKKQ